MANRVDPDQMAYLMADLDLHLYKARRQGLRQNSAQVEVTGAYLMDVHMLLICKPVPIDLKLTKESHHMCMAILQILTLRHKG